MICQNCHKNEATVTVVELQPGQSGPGEKTHTQQQLCEICAQSKNLPHAPVVKKSLGDIWKLLQSSGSPGPATDELTCPDCGMTRDEFRRRGRVGCERDYEIFAEDVREILERVHGATHHEGRLPGVSREEISRLEEIKQLEARLESAIRDEAYENAARIRDELMGLQGEPETPPTAE